MKKLKIFLDAPGSNGNVYVYVNSVLVGDFINIEGEMCFSDSCFKNHAESVDIKDILAVAEKTYDDYMDFFDTLDDWNNDSEMVTKYADDYSGNVKSLLKIDPNDNSFDNIDIIESYWFFARKTENVYANIFKSEDEFKKACYNLLIDKQKYFKNFVMDLQNTIKKANLL